MCGNFSIGCGVMVVAGSLNDLSASLAISAAVAGQLITAAAAAMGGWDRRRLLVLALPWYAAGHAQAALMPDFTALLPVRVASVLGTAVFTPQAAAAINVLATPAQRGRAITPVFLGWSPSSVLGMPMGSFISETFGWRWAFGAVALLAGAGALWVWCGVPDGVRAPPLSLQTWRRALTHPLPMAVVAVTALGGAGRFTLFGCFAPYYRQALGAGAATVRALFFWFGAFGLVGNLLLTRWIDRLGAARCVQIALSLMALSLLAWPWARGQAAMTLVRVPWALGCVSSNSAQQVRPSQSAPACAPAYAPALLALNTSAIHAGQATGAGGGGAILAAIGFGPMSWAGLAWMLLVIGLSARIARRMRRGAHV